MLFVKWKDQDIGYSSWVPEKKIISNQLAINAWYAEKLKSDMYTSTPDDMHVLPHTASEDEKDPDKSVVDEGASTSRQFEARNARRLSFLG